MKKLNIGGFLESQHSMKRTFNVFFGTGLRAPAALTVLMALAALLAISAQLVQAQTTSAPLSASSPKVEQFTLANGMTLIVKPDQRAPTAVHMLWVRVGAMDEVDGTSGVAHVLEHLMFKGTPTLPPGEFSRRVAALGGRENAFTARDYTGYYQQIPSNRLEDVMQLEADRFANNQWSDEEFKKEIEVVKEERRSRTEDNPRALMGEAMNAAVFVASPYRRPIVGWMNDLDAMTPNDAREFFRKWYVPANAAVVIAGDVDVARARQLAEKYYGGIAARPVPARKPQVEPQQSGLRRLDFKAPAEQSYLTMAFKVPSLTSLSEPGVAGNDALALTVLAAVLDGYSGARLDRALGQGDKRLADSSGAYNGLWGRGPQLFFLDGVPAQGKTAEEVEQALREQVARVAREGVSEAELNRVKTQWVAGEVYKLDSVFNQARALGVYWVQGQPLDAAEQLIARLRTVTSDQVKAVALKYFGDDQLTIATLRPQPLDKTRKPRTPAAGARH